MTKICFSFYKKRFVIFFSKWQQVRKINNFYLINNIRILDLKYNLSTDLNGECHIISRYISKQICLFKKKKLLIKNYKKRIVGL